MRAGLVIGAGISAILLIAAGAMIWQTVLWRTGWFRGPPPLAENLWAVAGSTSGPWSARLRESFPIGSAEDDLAKTLREQGFEIDAASRTAAYGWAHRPCVYTLTVTWRADDRGRVRAVQGGVLNACTDPDRLLPDRGPARRSRETSPVEPAPAPSLVPSGQSA